MRADATFLSVTMLMLFSGAAAALAGEGTVCRDLDRAALRWHRVTVGTWPDFSQRYYDPLLGPPCRVGRYFVRGCGLLGKAADDERHFSHRPAKRVREEPWLKLRPLKAGG